MCMPFDRRLQILLDDDRHDRLLAAAAERGVSVAAVVRDAIDRGLPGRDRQRRAAGQRILAAEDMPVPDLEGLRDELDALRGRRG